MIRRGRIGRGEGTGHQIARNWDGMAESEELRRDSRDRVTGRDIRDRAVEAEQHRKNSKSKEN